MVGPGGAPFIGPRPALGPSRRALSSASRMDEGAAVAALLQDFRWDDAMRARIDARAEALVVEARRRRGETGGLDAFLSEYGLSNAEGVVLMCLAEALLRIPDSETADALIRDKIGGAAWDSHLGQSESALVNASTWGLMLTGRVVRLGGEAADLGGWVGRVVARLGEPVIRNAVRHAMRIMARQFVMGATIEEALARAREPDRRHYLYSYDMLGEAALTQEDASRYLKFYMDAIHAIGAARGAAGPFDAPGISVKLSALHPRYEEARRGRVLDELTPRLAALAGAARRAGISLTVDAEEAARLQLSLDVIEGVLKGPDLQGWNGFGLAVQAYQKRAPAVIDWLAKLARDSRRRLMVRLVKGAYWDSEIKDSQFHGLSGYPVYTRKSTTDAAYLVCAAKLLASPDLFYPQFATHNAHTIAAIREMAGPDGEYEYQRLHGMGRILYDQIIGAADEGARDWGAKCRVYAPVGGHAELLPYLVRRLLENGANSSFVNRLVDDAAPIAEVIADPIARTKALSVTAHPRIPLPTEIAGTDRRIARGLDLTDALTLDRLAAAMAAALNENWRAAPIVDGKALKGRPRTLTNPADRRAVVGEVVEADGAALSAAIAAAVKSAPQWDRIGGPARAEILARAADAIEADMPALMALAVREAGKTIPDAVAEVREAVDFCRYYAARARADFGPATALPGPAGEANALSLHGRGVFGCISPWNFPLAIFTGQVAGALAAGNAVVAKPAEQTPLIAARAVGHLHAAGVPAGVLHLLPGDGATVGAALVADPRIAGIAFTGSTEAGASINRTLAGRPGPIAPLIAETGGLNAMIADSSALAEQVVRDVVISAFLSAGQRCSALRVLFVQDEVAPRLIAMLAGAMEELSVGDPALLTTDIGPVIDAPARDTLQTHAARMDSEARLIQRVTLPPETAHGTFFAPHAYEIARMEMLEREVFGPILHIVRFDIEHLDDVIAAINGAGYGLTLGIHSRIESRVADIQARVRVGNSYINRSMVGAVVGMQPFGGEGLSGTGPKAGGPHYLHRFAVERTRSTNIAAAGGNAALLTLEEGD